MLKFVGGNTETTAIIIIIIIISGSSSNSKRNKNLQKLCLWVLERGSRNHAFCQRKEWVGRNHTGLETYRAQE
jgi:hypothetical protein